ncbi:MULTISPECIES: HBL/NHE enterotoxin family protein [unclassified Streptomyces]|uniref:HBL/NHE enterotoxin family protein n=1 Tax=unclassified Streptomyces TaxID=2593676 RepID=UPI00365A0EE3
MGENPICPVEQFKDAFAEVFSTQALVQVSAVRTFAQPDVALSEIRAVVPSRQLARENATLWQETLQPKVVRVFTQAKAFSNIVGGGLTEQDVEELIADINTPAGKETFLEVVRLLHGEADKAAARAVETASDLDSFGTALESDLKNLHTTIAEADTKYSASDGRVEQAVTELRSLAATATEASVGLIASWAGFLADGSGLDGTAAVHVQLASVLAGSDRVLTAVPVVTASAAPAQFGSQAKTRDELAQRHASTLTELYALQPQLAVLHGIASIYDSLGEGAATTGQALTAFDKAWNTVATNLQGLIDTSQGTVGAEAAFLIKNQLKTLVADAGVLKTVAEFYEKNAVLPVLPDEEVAQLLRLPRSWIGRPVDGSVFSEFVTSRSRLGSSLARSKRSPLSRAWPGQRRGRRHVRQAGSQARRSPFPRCLPWAASWPPCLPKTEVSRAGTAPAAQPDTTNLRLTPLRWAAVTHCHSDSWPSVGIPCGRCQARTT